MLAPLDMGPGYATPLVMGPRYPTPHQYWHLVLATEAGCAHPTGMLSSLLLLLDNMVYFTQLKTKLHRNVYNWSNCVLYLLPKQFICLLKFVNVEINISSRKNFETNAFLWQAKTYFGVFQCHLFIDFVILACFISRASATDLSVVLHIP